MLVQRKNFENQEKSTNDRSPWKAVLSAAFLLLLMSACAQTATLTGSQPLTPDGQPLQPQEAFTDFPDLPIPDGARMDIERTFVFGGEDGWYGQTVITSNGNANQLFDFFKTYLDDMGWQEVTSVRAKTSVLTYLRGPRVLAIQITSSSFSRSEALITVSPAKSG